MDLNTYRSPMGGDAELSRHQQQAAPTPKDFVCPITSQVFDAPVTLETGQTYERRAIQEWLDRGNATCPITQQKLAEADREATPNHTLRRLTQAWCALHAVERFPTPRPPLDACRGAALVEEGRGAGRQKELAALREIKDIVAESDRNRRCVEATPGAVEFLVSVVRNHATTSKSAEDLSELSLDSPTSTSSPEEEALSVICSLKPSKKSLVRILEKNGDFLDTLVYMLWRPSYRSRCYGILLLKAMVSVMEPARLMAVRTEVVQELVRVVSDRVSAKAVKAALNVLCRLCPWGRNRVKAVEAGAMTVLVELLLDEGGRHPTEMAVVAIDHRCGCAQGRADGRRGWAKGGCGGVGDGG